MYKNQPSRIGGDIYRGIPTKKAQGVRKLLDKYKPLASWLAQWRSWYPVITWEKLLGRDDSIQPKTKQYIITEQLSVGTSIDITSRSRVTPGKEPNL